MDEFTSEEEYEIPPVSKTIELTDECSNNELMKELAEIKQLLKSLIEQWNSSAILKEEEVDTKFVVSRLTLSGNRIL